jgi:hypothetical protein
LHCILYLRSGYAQKEHIQLSEDPDTPAKSGEEQGF